MCQILNEPPNFVTMAEFFCQSGVISPDLVALIPGLFFHLFLSFQTHITIFTTNQCEKCPSSIRCWDSNPRPLEHEFHPITTRPGLPFALFVKYRFDGRQGVELMSDPIMR